MEVCADSTNWEWILVEIDSVGIWLGSPPPAIKLATAKHGGNHGDFTIKHRFCFPLNAGIFCLWDIRI